MSAGQVDILIEQGADFRLEMYVENPDGTPANFTGWTARMHVREELDDTAIIIDLTTENGRLVLSGDTIIMQIDHVDTRDVEITKGVFDLEVVDLSNYVTRLIEGKVRVKKEVTREHL